MKEFKYEDPKSFEELFAIIDESEEDEIKFLAGGTDMIPRLNLELQAIPKGQDKSVKIIYLGLLGLDSISEKGDVVRIGACSKLNDVKDNPIIRKKLPVLVETIREMAGVTIRNTATLGGNIMNASPAADSVPTLLALDADFVLRSRSGERTVKAASFFTSPGKTVIGAGEILTQIKITVGKGSASFRKLGRRQAETLSVVNAAAYVEAEKGVCKTARIAVGSAAPTVVRCNSAEQALEGVELNEDTVKKACEKVLDDISPIDDLRSSAWYRNKVAPVMAARAVKAAAGIE